MREHSNNPDSKQSDSPLSLDDALQVIHLHELGGEGISSASDRAWELATRYHDLKTGLHRSQIDGAALAQTAIRAVLARARAVIGSSKKETRKRTDPIIYRPHAELNIEQTIDNIADKPYPDGSDILVDFKEQKRLDCALMLDTSLSMSGEKLALLAVSATVLAYKLPPEDFAIICFESTANTVKPMRKTLTVEQIAQAILEVPAIGYTNIHAGLTKGLQQLARGRHRNRVGILISDGKYTAGDDPLPVASAYKQLHVVLIGTFNINPDACVHMADQGHGRVYRAPHFQSLPRVLNRLISDLLA